MRKEFLAISFAVIASIAGIGYFWNWVWGLYVLVLPVFLLGLVDILQAKKAVRKNFPVIGNFRYLFEKIRPEIQQYFVEDNTNGTPISREFRSVVYQRAKQQLDTIPFGTQRNVYDMGYEWLNHSISPKHVDPKDLRVTIGGPDCKQPYSASVFNISAMSYGALSKQAIMSLNGGAKLGNFFHNTGEGSVSPYHEKPGGDLVWQIGTGYFGCRTPDGNFDPEKFKSKASSEQIKMIEIKVSQGAKPAHGGILPAQKITPEIAKIRDVPLGKDVLSPPYHKMFNTPQGLLDFIKQLRDLSDGKPVGFKICVGHPHEFISICKAMLRSKIYPDFISVDGGEGGTGAAPLEFSNAVGTPLDEGLVFVHDILTGYDLRKHIKIISSGKILTAFQMFNKIALGADALTSARGMMLALGCIQARACNSNHCPVGVATQNPALTAGLHVPSKTERVFQYHKNSLIALAELVGASGVSSLKEIDRSFVFRRISRETYKSYEQLFPSVERGSFLEGRIPDHIKQFANQADSETFSMKKVA